MKDDGRSVTAEREFDSPEEGRSVLAQLGPFRELRLQTKRSLLTTKTQVSGILDLSAGLATFSDDDLRKKLGGPGLGLDPAAVKEATGADLAQLLTLAVSVVVPGKTVRLEPKLGATVPINASAEQYNVQSIGFLVLAALAGVWALVLITRIIRRKRHTPSVR